LFLNGYRFDAVKLQPDRRPGKASLHELWVIPDELRRIFPFHISLIKNPAGGGAA
jgi:hypothetical protein